MSAAIANGLPRTRSLRRRRGARGWTLAISVALALNLAVIVGLGRISHLDPPPATPPLQVHRLTRLAPAPPAPPPASHPAPTVLSDLPAAIPALPLLDLPALPDTRLALPMLGTLEAPVELPLAIPAAPALATPAGPLAELPDGSLAVDTPAMRDGDFDLDRFYPRSARARGIAGTSRIRSHIDATGRVTAVEVLDSQPPGVFEHAAERLGRAQHYQPALRGGVRVPTVQETVIEWSLR